MWATCEQTFELLVAPRHNGVRRYRITMLDLAQNLAHDASTEAPRKLILRARKLRGVHIVRE